MSEASGVNTKQKVDVFFLLSRKNTSDYMRIYSIFNEMVGTETAWTALSSCF